MSRVTVFFFGIVLSIILGLFFWHSHKSNIGTSDACLCTELLAKESFLQNKNKIKAVEDCVKLFKNFEEAHLKCMEKVPFEHPEIKIDSIKTT